LSPSFAGNSLIGCVARADDAIKPYAVHELFDMLLENPHEVKNISIFVFFLVCNFGVLFLPTKISVGFSFHAVFRFVKKNINIPVALQIVPDFLDQMSILEYKFFCLAVTTRI
jgi:hypothetical protein